MQAPNMDRLQANQVCTLANVPELSLYATHSVMQTFHWVAADWHEVLRELSVGCKRLSHFQ